MTNGHKLTELEQTEARGKLMAYDFPEDVLAYARDIVMKGSWDLEHKSTNSCNACRRFYYNVNRADPEAQRRAKGFYLAILAVHGVGFLTKHVTGGPGWDEFSEHARNIANNREPNDDSHKRPLTPASGETPRKRRLVTMPVPAGFPSSSTSAAGAFDSIIAGGADVGVVAESSTAIMQPSTEDVTGAMKEIDNFVVAIANERRLVYETERRTQSLLDNAEKLCTDLQLVLVDYQRLRKDSNALETEFGRHLRDLENKLETAENSQTEMEHRLGQATSSRDAALSSLAEGEQRVQNMTRQLADSQTAGKWICGLLEGKVVDQRDGVYLARFGCKTVATEDGKLMVRFLDRHAEEDADEDYDFSNLFD